MKLLLFSVLLASCNYSIAQWNFREDTACYRIQEIAIPYSALHDQEFVSHGQKSDLFYYVYLLNRENKLGIDTIHSTDLPILPYMEDIEKGLNKSEPMHEYFDLEMNMDVFAYKLVLYPDMLFDEFGEPITQVNGSGNLEYVWGKTDSIICTFYSISDVILTSQKYIDWDGELSESKTLTFIMLNAFGDKRKILSISYEEFMKKMSDYLINKRINLPWYEKLVNDTFKGYRYFHIPCGMEFSGF